MGPQAHQSRRILENKGQYHPVDPDDADIWPTLPQSASEQSVIRDGPHLSPC